MSNEEDTSTETTAEVVPLWRARLSYGRTGALKSNSANAQILMFHHPKLQGVFGYNELFEASVLLKEPPFTTHLLPGDRVDWAGTVQLAGWLSTEENAGFTPQLMGDALVAVARLETFNPIRRYLSTISWDQVNRLENAHRLWNLPDQAPFDEFMYRWFIGAVARALSPGCKMDTMLVLEGPQGFHKSSSIRALVPVISWYREAPIDTVNKDGELMNNGCWLREIGELAGMNRQDINRLKSYLSRQEDNYRAPYERQINTFKRRCIYIGTTNQQRYLYDSTGGRRFWPCPVQSPIDIDRIEFLRDQLWAEATARFEAGERWHLDTEYELTHAIKEQEARLAR